MNKQKQKPILIAKKSIFIFSFSVIFSFISLLVLVQNFNFLLFSSFLILNFLLFYFKNKEYKEHKIVITAQKIYVLHNKKIIFKLNFLSNFKIISYEETKISSLFQSGTIYLVDINNQMYTFKYCHNPKKVYDIIVKSYEKNINKD